MELENEQNAKELDNIRISLKYMKTSCVDINGIMSSFDSEDNAQK